VLVGYRGEQSDRPTVSGQDDLLAGLGLLDQGRKALLEDL
jgi:hypothetical protein